MPELPEVETVRAGLEPVLRGRRFINVEQRRPDLRFPLPERFVERLTGRTVERLERRAKYILVHLDGGEVLAVHLGMTGRFSVQLPASPSPRPSRGEGRGEGRQQASETAAAPHPSPLPAEERGEGIQLGEFTHEHGHDAKHDHLVLTMSGGAVVTYNDARRFGYMTLVRETELNDHAYFAGLGVEPLSDALSPAYLAGRAQARKVDLKALLMDQRVVAGLGNIYVCEALFRARLDPFKGAARLATKTGKPTPAAVRLVAAIKAVLTDAVRRRRLDAARLQAGGRLARSLPAPVCGLRTRRRALLETGLPGQGAPQDAGRAIDILLPDLPALIVSHPEGMEQAMAYETIIVETKGRVGLVRLNRPAALNALNAQVIEELGAALDGFEADDGIGCIVITGSEKAFAAGADIKEMQSKTYMSAFKEDFIYQVVPGRQHPQARGRSGRRLRARRWMRAGHDVRHHHRRRHGQVRPAGDQAGCDAGVRRHAAAHPPGR